MRTLTKNERIRKVRYKLNRHGLVTSREACYLLFPNDSFPCNKTSNVNRWIMRNINRYQDLKVEVPKRSYYHHQYNKHIKKPPSIFLLNRWLINQIRQDEQWMNKTKDYFIFSNIEKTS